MYNPKIGSGEIASGHYVCLAESICILPLTGGEACGLYGCPAESKEFW